VVEVRGSRAYWDCRRVTTDGVCTEQIAVATRRGGFLTVETRFLRKRPHITDASHQALNGPAKQTEPPSGLRRRRTYLWAFPKYRLRRRSRAAGLS